MRFIDEVLDLIFPKRCSICGSILSETERAMCEKCVESARACTKHEAGYSATVYDGVIKDAITKFKFKGKREFSSPLSNILINFIENLPAEGSFHAVDVVVPVPLFHERQKERGYNQSELLAARVAQHLKLPLDGNVLVRARKTKPQFDLKREERFKNVRDAFIVPKTEEIAGRNVLLVDDILTTGATTAECSKALKQAGAKNVVVLTLARTIE